MAAVTVGCLLIALSACTGVPRPKVSADAAQALWDAIRRDDLTSFRRIVTVNPEVVQARHAVTMWTPLHWVVTDGRGSAVGMAKVLLEAGADANARDSEHNTPLHLAGVRLGRESLSAEIYLGLIQTLLQGGANVSARNYLGMTPLHTWSIAGADVAAVELLISRGADVNARATREGWSPLHGAASKGRLDLVTLLLGSGADLMAKDARGRTPLEVAEIMGQREVATLLRTRGASR